MKKILLVGLFLVSIGMTAQSAKLRYDLKKGDKFLVELTLKQNMAPILSMDIDLGMILQATGKQGSDFETQYKISEVKMDVAAQGQNMTFDSKKKDSELTDEERKVKAEIEPALKMIVYQTLSSLGKVTSTKIEPQVQGAAAMVSQNQFLFIEYPTEAVKVGSSWDFGQNMNGVNTQTKYVVTKITNTEVYADITGSIQGTTDAKVGGKVIIDRGTGMMNSMIFDLSVGSTGMGSMSMNVNLTTKKI